MLPPFSRLNILCSCTECTNFLRPFPTAPSTIRFPQALLPSGLGFSLPPTPAATPKPTPQRTPYLVPAAPVLEPSPNFLLNRPTLRKLSVDAWSSLEEVNISSPLKIVTFASRTLWAGISSPIDDATTPISAKTPGLAPCASAGCSSKIVPGFGMTVCKACAGNLRVSIDSMLGPDEPEEVKVSPVAKIDAPRPRKSQKYSMLSPCLEVPEEQDTDLDLFAVPATPPSTKLLITHSLASTPRQDAENTRTASLDTTHEDVTPSTKYSMAFPPLSTASTDVKPVSKDVKPVSKDLKPVSKDLKPASKENKPVSKETKPASKETRLASKETRSASKEIKPASKETRSASKEIKPASKEIKPASKEIKPASKDIKLVSTDIRPASTSISTHKTGMVTCKCCGGMRPEGITLEATPRTKMGRASANKLRASRASTGMVAPGKVIPGKARASKVGTNTASTKPEGTQPEGTIITTAGTSKARTSTSISETASTESASTIITTPSTNISDTASTQPTNTTTTTASTSTSIVSTSTASTQPTNPIPPTPSSSKASSSSSTTISSSTTTTSSTTSPPLTRPPRFKPTPFKPSFSKILSLTKANPTPTKPPTAPRTRTPLGAVDFSIKHNVDLDWSGRLQEKRGWAACLEIVEGVKRLSRSGV